MKPRYPIPVLAALVLVASLSGTSAAEDFISRKEALARSNLVVVSGDHNEEWRVCATKNRAYDLRKFTSSGNFGDLSNLSIGKDCGAARTVVVGGTVTGTISHSLRATMSGRPPERVRLQSLAVIKGRISGALRVARTW